MKRILMIFLMLTLSAWLFADETGTVAEQVLKSALQPQLLGADGNEETVATENGSVTENVKYTRDDLVQIMLSSSPSLRASELNRQKSMADYKSSLGKLGPTIKYGFSASFFANPIDPIRLSYSEFAGMIPLTGNSLPTDGYVQLYDGSEKSYYSANLSLLQPIGTGGKLVYFTRINKELYNISAATASENRKKDVSKLTASLECFKYLSDMEKSLEVADNDVDELISLSDQFEKAGMITRAKNLETVTSAYKVRAGYQTVRSQKNSQLEMIRTITGKYDLQADELDIELPPLEHYEQILKENRLELVAKALSPEQESMKIRASMENIAELNRKIGLASMPFSPDIFLYASLSYATPRFPLFETDWYGKGNWQATLAVSLSGTLFDSLTQYNNYSASKLKKESEAEQTKQARREIESTFLGALYTIESAIANIRYKEAELAEKTQAYEDAVLSYGQGSISRVDYLSAEIKKAASEVELHQEYIKLLVNYYIVDFFIKGIGNE